MIQREIISVNTNPITVDAALLAAGVEPSNIRCSNIGLQCPLGNASNYNWGDTIVQVGFIDPGESALLPVRNTNQVKIKSNNIGDSIIITVFN